MHACSVCICVCVHNLAVKGSMLQSLLALKAAQSKRKLENLTKQWLPPGSSLHIWSLLEAILAPLNLFCSTLVHLGANLRQLGAKTR